MNICPFMVVSQSIAGSPPVPIYDKGSTEYVSHVSGQPLLVSDEGVIVSRVKDANGVALDDVKIIYHECLQSKCQLWDSINSRCGAQVSDTIRNSANETDTLITLLEGVLGKVSEKDGSLLVFLQNILGDSTEKSAAVTSNSLIELLNHIHASHYHSSSHECPQIPATCGTYTFGGSVPYAAKLVNEFAAYEDLDGNNYIYGKDFKVADSSDKPPMLIAIEENPIWVDPSLEVSWADLKLWSENPAVNPNPLP